MFPISLAALCTYTYREIITGVSKSHVHTYKRQCKHKRVPGGSKL